jgi:hypothetical protein
VRKADEPLVRCNMLHSTRVQLYEIMLTTGERMWEVLRRLIAAEHVRLFNPEEEGLAEEKEA